MLLQIHIATLIKKKHNKKVGTTQKQNVPKALSNITKVKYGCSGIEAGFNNKLYV
tara:strand:+ start:513 stop:677 length:165 start_codon:yes stop_codon:yes gene_type:complete